MKNDKGLKKCYTVSQRGYITVLSVLFIAAICVPIITLLFSYSHNFFGILSSDEFSYQAKYYAHTCLDKGIFEVQDNGGVATSGGETLADGTCNYTVSVITGGWQVDAVGESHNRYYRYRAVISAISPSIEITSIIPVSNF